MENWEYLVLEQPPGVIGFADRHTKEQYPGSLHSVLNAIGTEGWQLMSMDTGPDGRVVLVLGRRSGHSFA